MSNWVEFLPLVVLAVAFWFLVLRPARNRQKDFLATQQQLHAGARVMIASGIFGEIQTVGDDEVGLLVAPGVVITVNRQAVARVIEPTADDVRTDEEQEGTD